MGTDFSESFQMLKDNVVDFFMSIYDKLAGYMGESVTNIFLIALLAIIVIFVLLKIINR